MPEAYYMMFEVSTDGSADVCDRVGGIPSQLPANFPTSPTFGKEYCFLMQITSVSRLGLTGIGAIQIYQSGEIDEGDDPTPVALLVASDSPLNKSKVGRPCPGIEPSRIDWEVRQDPDEFPATRGVTDELRSLLGSKVGGVAPAVKLPLEGARFLGQIAEQPCGFNFGGLLLLLWMRPDGRLFCELV